MTNTSPQIIIRKSDGSITSAETQTDIQTALKSPANCQTGLPDVSASDDAGKHCVKQLCLPNTESRHDPN